MIRRTLVLAFLAPLPLARPAPAADLPDLPVTTDAQFNAALQRAKPGDHIRLGKGPFKGGFFAAGVAGTEREPVRISGPSPEEPAVFDDPDKTILQLVGARHVVVENLRVTRAGGHGLAFDDGGKRDFSCNHVTVRHCRIDDVAAKGGHCSIKLAGVADLAVQDCTFRGWGAAGCAVDGVGCRRGSVDRCTFLPERGSVAVQFKGGSEDVTVAGCLFDDLTDAGVQIGGATDIGLFRPEPQGFEARRITVQGNTFVGCVGPVAFANADGADVWFNTFYLPRKWALRILQDNDRADFTPCRGGRVENNIIVFRSDRWLEGGVNVGPKTAPETFRFAGNAWYCADAPAKSAPRLPTKEADAVIGKDPRFTDPAAHDFTLQPASPLKGKGYTAAPTAPTAGRP